MNIVNENNIELESKEIKALANCLIPFIKSFFTSDEGRREFKEWQERRGEKCEQ